MAPSPTIMLWMQETFPLNETDRVLQKTPISFDASVWECYAALTCRCPMCDGPSWWTSRR